MFSCFKRRWVTLGLIIPWVFALEASAYHHDGDRSYESNDQDSVATEEPLQATFDQLLQWKDPFPQPVLQQFSSPIEEYGILEEISQLVSKRQIFTGTFHNHMMAVSRLKDIFKNQPSAQAVIQKAAELRDRNEINPNVWLRALIGVSMERPDMQGLNMPPLVEVLPSLFLNDQAMYELTASLNARSGQQSRDKYACTTVIDESVGTDNGEEHKLWYFREDVMVNAHHWYWHLVWSYDRVTNPEDRSGELFYYMHHCILARYHLDRAALNLPALYPYNISKGSSFPHGYNPHLHDGNSGKKWGARPNHQTFSDIQSKQLGEPFFISMDERLEQQKRIIDAINAGFLVNSHNDKVIYISKTDKIDLFGSIIEATINTINPIWFGAHGIHNDGHNIISLALDPQEQGNIPPGVMADTATALRDPIFYAHHFQMELLMQMYKDKLPPYRLWGGEWPLKLDGIRIENVELTSAGGKRQTIFTHFSYTKYDVSRGLDFNKTQVNGPMIACVKHLNHFRFQYALKIFRKPKGPSKITIRIFLGPTTQLYDRSSNINLEDSRNLMVIMDIFQDYVQPGWNYIYRDSDDTPLVVNVKQHHSSVNDTTNKKGICGCGWPSHLLSIRGSEVPMKMNLFAMATDAANDGDFDIADNKHGCKPAWIFCGLSDAPYPDKRPMGYPFDRKIISDRQGQMLLNDLVAEVPNMAMSEIQIIHKANGKF